MRCSAFYCRASAEVVGTVVQGPPLLVALCRSHAGVVRRQPMWLDVPGSSVLTTVSGLREASPGDLAEIAAQDAVWEVLGS